jgi:hypothetical protein
MSDHGSASDGSKIICEKLFNALRKRIPKLQRAETKKWCAFFEPGKNRFAYLSHRKTSSGVQIWCAGDLDLLVRNSFFKVIPRDKIRGGWEERFPARFYLDHEHQIDAAVSLLFSISYQHS